MNFLSGQLAVHGRERVELVLERGRVLGVEEDLCKLAAVGVLSEPLSSDFGREDQVFEDVLVDVLERP